MDKLKAITIPQSETSTYDLVSSRASTLGLTFWQYIKKLTQNEITQDRTLSWGSVPKEVADEWKQDLKAMGKNASQYPVKTFTTGKEFVDSLLEDDEQK